jgi:hypothetical protein
MKITRKHYDRDMEYCNRCSEFEEFIPGKCSKCIILLHSKAYDANHDTNDYFWKNIPHGRDGGNWVLKSRFPNKKFEKITRKDGLVYFIEKV